MGGVFDINGSELLVIAVIAVILVGPERLPEYARGLRTLVKRARGAVRDGQNALREEFGDDVDWEQLDPRRYDPRKIVRDALFDEDDDATPATGTAAVAAVATGATGTGGTVAVGSRRDRRQSSAEHGVAQPVPGTPFDDEAT